MNSSRLLRSAALLTAAAAATVGLAACGSDSSPAASDSSSSSASGSDRAFDLQAHRGGRGEHTEESLYGFEQALKLGVDTLELDIVLTKDLQPIIWHDPTIDPTKCSDTAAATPGDPQFPYVGKVVHDLTYKQIETLTCGKKLEGFPDAKVVEGNKIALLPQLFALADKYNAKVHYNIETKIEGEKRSESATPQQYVDVMLGAIKAAGKTDLVDIQSFDWRTLPLVKEANPSIPLVALWDETTWKPKSQWTGSVDYDAVGGDVIAGAKQLGVQVLSPGYSNPYGQTTKDAGFRLIADKSFVDRAHSQGFTVIPWTINDTDVMNAQIDAGADGIITDYPTRLRQVLADRKMPLPATY
ncbi:glycerophosphodiester phosphodiesterase family protein [Williamsia phyllosphaerae]|uniref:Glycerophosphoryl diester phosphodiesterase (GlpQ) n=1 Tax=Williamsia phyllosphaerae TaxID=885042 RepID=A0ABQ1U1D0_9NOCA|nr:putative glycerophosphoryl diester phosphodiesterase precursor (GlpQ) [Williamsia phyllosphaerae]